MSKRRSAPPLPSAPNAAASSSAGRLDSDDDSDQSGDGGHAVDTSSQKPKSINIPIPRVANTSSSATNKKQRKAVARKADDDGDQHASEVILRLFFCHLFWNRLLQNKLKPHPAPRSNQHCTLST
jgi:hypothetical protein